MTFRECARSLERAGCIHVVEDAIYETLCDEADEGVSAEWEDLCANTDRLKVPGGWLYRTVVMDEVQDAIGVAMVFVPGVR
jgi:hypothetical protein